MNKEIKVKKLIFTLLTSSILFTIGCEDEKKEESVEAESIIGTWTLSAVCMFADENCLGECSSEYTEDGQTYDLYEQWIEIEGGFSMTFSEGGSGALTGTGDGGEWTDAFNWSGSGPYTLTAEGEEPLTVTLSDGSITWASVDDVCLQFTLIK